jgi:tetratricopeptide (TPR) repeat protein
MISAIKTHCRQSFRLYGTPACLRRRFFVCLLGTLLALFGLTAEGREKARGPARAPEPDYSLHEAVQRGKQALESKEYPLAIRLFTSAIAKNPDALEPYLYRGRAHDLSGAAAAAIKDFTRFLELKPSDPIGYVYRGDARNFNMEHETALEDYNRAIKLSPSSVAGHLGRGLAFTGLERYPEAIKDFQWVLTLDPKNYEALGNLGVACMLAQRPIEAVSYFEQALKFETDPKWRKHIDDWIEKLMVSAKTGAPRSEPPPKPKGPVRSLW